MFSSYSIRPPEEWSTLKKLIWLRGNPATGQIGTDLTVSGTPPLTLTNSLGKPLKAWSVELSPYQDLHGYDSPWPAGGGKNLYNMDDDQYGEDKYWSLTTGDLVASSDYYASPKIPVQPDTQYVRNAGANANLFYDVNGDYLYYASTGQSITTPSNAYYVAFNIPVDVDHATVQLEKGTTSTAWTPYSNICPILGTDKVTITTAGKNLYDMSQQIQLSSNTMYGCQLLPNAQYTFSIGTAATGLYINYSDDETMPNITTGTWNSLTTKYNNTFITFNSGAHKWYRFNVYFAGGYVETTYQLEFGSTATSYTPYLAPSQTVIDVPPLSANQWDEEWEEGRYNYDTGDKYASTINIRSKNLIPVQANTTYYFYCGNGSASPRFCYYNANGEFIGNDLNTQSNQTFTTPDNCAYLTVYMTTGYGTTYNHDISINYPSTVTTYNPFTNTLYGGTVGSNGGENGSAVIILDGTQSINNQKYDGAENIVARWDLPTGKGAKSTSTGSLPPALCETMKPASNAMIGNFSSWSNQANLAYSYTIAADGSRVGIALPQSLGITNNTQLNAYLAANPIKVVYEVATPTEFAVTTPPIPTTKGNATTWATAEDGTVDSMSVTYVGKA